MEIADVLPRSQVLVKELSEGRNGGLCRQADGRCAEYRSNGECGLCPLGPLVLREHLARLGGGSAYLYDNRTMAGKGRSGRSQPTCS